MNAGNLHTNNGVLLFIYFRFSHNVPFIPRVYRRRRIINDRRGGR